MKKALMGLIVALSMAVITPTLAAFPEKNLQGIIQWGAGGSSAIATKYI